MKQRSPKEILTLFRRLLNEASTTLGKPKHAINSAQFELIADGRLGQRSLSKLGGYQLVREYIAPSPGGINTKAELKCLERILNNAKAA